MATGTATSRGVTFRVLDAMDSPHSGRILRLRLQSGEAPSIKALRGARLRATSPEGVTTQADVVGFAVFGGKPSDDRLARTGRVDVQVAANDGPDIGIRWEVTFA